MSSRMLWIACVQNDKIVFVDFWSIVRLLMLYSSCVGNSANLKYSSIWILVLNKHKIILYRKTVPLPYLAQVNVANR